MTQEKPGDDRKLSTILAMDVANYSQKMGADEEGTIQQLKACRSIIEKNVSSSNGRIFNTAGDAFMVEFGNTLAGGRWGGGPRHPSPIVVCRGGCADPPRRLRCVLRAVFGELGRPQYKMTLV